MTLAKIAIVGCGRPAQRWHLPTLAELARRGRIDFVAVCDLDQELAARVGGDYGLPHYANVEEMLDRHKDIMAVDVVTGDPSHHAVARLVAEHGRHVLVEKPMAVTLPCCDVIVDACRRNGVYFEVAENYFRMPKQRAIAKILGAGILGEIVRVHFVEPKGRRFRSFEAGAKPKNIGRPVSRFASYSGVFLDTGAHRFSQLRIYAGSEPTRMVAALRKYRADPEFVHEDWGHALVDFDSGAVGVYETSRLGEETVKYCQIAGTQGRILDHDTFGPQLPLRVMVGGGMRDIPVEFQRRRVGDLDVLNRIVVHTDPPITYENPYADCAIDDWSVGHAEEIMSIANAAANDEPPEYGLGGRKDVEMCMAAYESSIQGMRPVELPIHGITSYEKMLHDDHRDQFGRAIDQA